MEKGKNIIITEHYILKENLLIEKNGMVNYIALKEMKYLK